MGWGSTPFPTAALTGLSGTARSARLSQGEPAMSWSPQLGEALARKNERFDTIGAVFCTL
jgi:hypothetical protein